jgi:predicted CopG family antitoxin
MTDFSKYRNISLDHDTYKKLEKLSKSVAPIPMSMSKTLLILINLLKKRGKIK